jgi:hypothetical protein
MSGIERVPLPPIPDGPITGAMLRDILSIMQRDMLRFADVRNATTDEGIVVSGGANGFAQLSYAAGVQDRAFQPRYQPPVATNPGGATTQVQFNDAGAFGGDAGLAFNKTTNVLQLGESGTAGKFEAPSLSGASGLALTVEAGDTSFSGGTGGALTLRAGTPTAGPGGLVLLEATAGVGSNRAGGGLTINGGAATGSANGGAVTITSGASPGGSAGTLFLIAGTSATGTSAGVVMNGGAGTDTASGGGFAAQAGDGGPNGGAGGLCSFVSGNAFGTGDNAGAITFTAGYSIDADGGSISFTTGDALVGQIGNINFTIANGSGGSGGTVGTLVFTGVPTTGSAGAIAGYLVVTIDGTSRKIPYYAT